MQQSVCLVAQCGVLFPGLLLWLLVQVEAERLAWQLAEELGLDVVTILPNFVLVGAGASLMI